MVSLLAWLGEIISIHQTEATLKGSWRLIDLTHPSSRDNVTLGLDGQGNATLKIKNREYPQVTIYGVVAAKYKIHYDRIDFFDEKIIQTSDEFNYDPRPWCAYINFKGRNLISVYEPPTPPLRTTGWNMGDDISPYETFPAVNSEWRRIP